LDEDAQQLRRFVESGSEDAFRWLVDRYLGLVVGAAKRRCGDHALAEEIAQDVFTALAKKAGTLREPLNLAAWLHRSAHLQTSHRLRAEYNRKRKMNSLKDHIADQHRESADDASWGDAVPHLDAALDSLSTIGREIVLQRYYGDRSFRAISQQIDKSEGATQRRGSRAIAKMSRFLKGRGVTLSATAITAGLAAQLATPATAATIAMGTTITSAASTTTGAAASAAAATTIQVMSSTKIALIAAPLLLAIPIGYFALKDDDQDDANTKSAPALNTKGEKSGRRLSAFVQLDQDGKKGLPENPNSPEAIIDELKKLAAKGQPLALASITLRLNTLTREEAPYAFEFLSENLDQFGDRLMELESMIQTFWMRWGEVDVTAALEKTGEDKTLFGHDMAYKFMFRGYGKSDPEGAAKYIIDHPDMPRRHMATEGLAVSWAEKDPLAVTDFVLNDLDGREQNLAMSAIPWGINNTQGHEAALEWWRGLLDGERRANAFDGVASIYQRPGKTSFDERIALVKEGMAHRLVNQPLYREIADKLGRNEPIRGAEIFSEGSPHPETGVYPGFFALMRTWTITDQAAAGDWISNQLDQPWIETAIAGYANTLRSSNPESAAEWVEQIENETLRKRATEVYYEASFGP